MIHTLIVYLLIYLLLAGTGLYLANARVNRKTRTQRWLKYGVYSLIVYGVLLSIVWRIFAWLAVGIAIAALLEILQASTRIRMNLSKVSAILGYLLIASGFLMFSWQFNVAWLLFVYFQVLSFDAFSQIVGQLLGQQRVMPQISPWKTLEGLLGGLAFCLLSSVLARHWLEVSLLKAVFLGLFTAGLAFLGDTLASYVKRLARIKDYGTWLPGQGGCLDRFDSLLMVGFGYACLAPLGVW